MLRSSSFTDDVIFAHTGPHRGTRCRRSEWRHCVVVCRLTSFLLRPWHWRQPRRGCRDTSPIFWLGGRQREYPPILLRTFGYSRPILVAPRSQSLKPISFGYKTPPIRFSQAGGQSAHKARPPILELALTSPLVRGSTNCTNFFKKFVKIRKSSFH